ncbi:MAG: dipicolinate synthase subunit B [Eubacterium sp.]|nr:dipicolinate synthase subunit B [Eubacterium sp.]
MIGYCFCGSFCTVEKSLKVLRSLAAEGNDILPVMNDSVYFDDTRFGKAEDIRSAVQNICGREIIHTVVGAEPIGPSIKLDMLVIAPCTGNTLAKMAMGITDSAVTMAAKAQLRADRPVVIALATNDALSSNLKNIGTMLQRKNVYFVPVAQDDPKKKPHSLICNFDLLKSTMVSAFAGRQLQPVLLGALKNQNAV